MKIAIIGAGKLGITIAESLLFGDNEITLVDKNNELLQKLSNQMDLLTVTANAKQITVLKQMEIWTYDYLVAVTPEDEKNIVICSFAKKLGCPRVIARIRDPEHVSQIEFIKECMNIDYIVNPDLAISNEIYKYLVEKYSLNNGYFSAGKISILEFKTNKLPALIGKPVCEVSDILPHMLITAVSRNGKVIIPHGDTVLKENDSLYVVGESEPLLKLSETVHENKKYTDLQRVMIAGGGKTAYFLAQSLAAFGVAVKIIEIDKKRCQYLSEHLNNVMILHGDATDQNLLTEENIDDMDAFVTVTGYDEENLLLALLANQKDIEDVVAKVSRKSYATLIEKMGISMALNPLDITASSILRFIQGSNRIVSSQLIHGQAELVQIAVDSQMKMKGTPLRQLNLPDSLMIAAIYRKNHVLIPTGNTVIQEGDRVIVMCLLSNMPDLEKLFRVKRRGLFG